MILSLSPGDVFWAVFVFGILAMIIVGLRMKPGMGPYNLRALGIVFVGTAATLMGIFESSLQSATMGILGGIAGYLFGSREQEGGEK